MEQKQLDEIDESYFGEEFVDEEPVKKESKKAETKSTKPKKTEKKTIKKAITKKTTKSEKKVTENKESKKEDNKEEVSITPVKEEVKIEEIKSEVESSTPVDPWASEENVDSGFGTGTWKVITGILLILLIFSVFTNGFDFAEGTSVNGKPLLLSEAESKALDFVNSNLLQPPFVAEVESSSEINGLYKVSLSVAGQSVDSYITKDGNLFFPQGFEINAVKEEVIVEEPVSKLENLAEEASEETEEPVAELENLAEEASEETEEPVAELENLVEEASEETEELVAEVPAEKVTLTGDVKTVSLVAKKWSFSPDTISVKLGDVVKLNIAPDTSKAAFSLNEFTFAVSGFGIEEEVSDATVVEFTASKAGNFVFTCSSCEDWRGMSGTLVVE